MSKTWTTEEVRKIVVDSAKSVRKEYRIKAESMLWFPAHLMTVTRGIGVGALQRRILRALKESK